jgi:hypothetical protein
VRKLRLLVVILLAVALSSVGLSAASASDSRTKPPEIKNLGSVATISEHNRTVARVTGTYRCWGPSDSMHLWVSVKQGGPDPTAEGSSSTVKAWYDTNISGDVQVRCDGDWHTKTVKLGRHATDFSGRPLGYLHEGRAWLQFCLVPPSGEQFLASKSRWVTIED